MTCFITVESVNVKHGNTIMTMTEKKIYVGTSDFLKGLVVVVVVVVVLTHCTSLYIY